MRGVVLGGLLVMILLAGCFSGPSKASARIYPVTLGGAEGDPVGWANATKKGDALQIRLTAITEMTGGEHAVHVHERGGCGMRDGVPAGEAGGHFDPGDDDHPAHAGDLGNVTAAPNGVIDATLLAPDLRLRGGASIIGKSI